MTKKQKIWYATGGSLACVAIVALVAYWFSGRHYDKVVTLIDELSSSELSRAEYNRVRVELMRTMDEMPRDKVREVYEKLRDKRRADERAAIQAFHAAAESEKNAILDDSIAKWEQGREIMGALRTDMAWGRGGRGRGRGGEERGRQGETDERTKEQIEAERQLRGQYYEALKKRAEELGKDDPRGRGDRRGRGGR